MGRAGENPTLLRMLLSLLLYGYAAGVFSSRKIERAPYEAVPFHFIAGNPHPDHDTLAAFRRTFLPELRDLFVQVLLLATSGRHAEIGHDEPGRNESACRCARPVKQSATNGSRRWRLNDNPRLRNCASSDLHAVFLLSDEKAENR